jgi:pSer/pThr/pTyr-binding forkhead associated (FHA) protein
MSLDEARGLPVKVELASAADPDGRIVLDKLPAILGQGCDAEVRLDDSWVCPYHCLLSEEDGLLVVLDLGSRTGTYIDGMRVRRAHLMPGDTLTVGRTSFVVEYDVDLEAANRGGCPYRDCRKNNCRDSPTFS